MVKLLIQHIIFEAIYYHFQFEFGGTNIDTRTYFRDFWYFFKECGFILYRITPLGAELIRTYRESDEYFMTTNFIAVKRK